MEGIKHPHRRLSLHLPSPSLSQAKQFNKNCAGDSTDAYNDAKPRGLQPSHIDKKPAHTEEQISLKCSVAGSA